MPPFAGNTIFNESRHLAIGAREEVLHDEHTVRREPANQRSRENGRYAGLRATTLCLHFLRECALLIEHVSRCPLRKLREHPLDRIPVSLVRYPRVRFGT